MTRLYVSGPIAAIRDTAEEVFKEACDKLNSLGYQTVNPFDCGAIHMENCDCHAAKRNYNCVLRGDIKSMMDCDSIALLPGWETSVGCAIELYIAGSLHMTIHPIKRWIDIMMQPF